MLGARFHLTPDLDWSGLREVLRINTHLRRLAQRVQSTNLDNGNQRDWVQSRKMKKQLSLLDGRLNCNEKLLAASVLDWQ